MNSNLGQVVHTHVPLSPSSIVGTYAVKDSSELLRSAMVNSADTAICSADLIASLHQYVKSWQKF